MSSTDDLREAYEAARTEAKANPTAENRKRVKAAWTAYDESVPQRKPRGYASRAGKRQAAEREAMRRRRR